MKSRFPDPKSTTLECEKLRMGSDKAFCQKEIESIKCEVAKLNLLEQVLNFKSGKGMSTQPLVEVLLVHVPYKENIIDFSPQHSTSRGHKH